MTRPLFRHARGACLLLASSLTMLPSSAAFEAGASRPGTAAGTAPLDWPGPSAFENTAAPVGWQPPSFARPGEVLVPPYEMPGALAPVDSPYAAEPSMPSRMPESPYAAQQVAVPQFATPQFATHPYGTPLPGTSPDVAPEDVGPPRDSAWEPIAVGDGLPATPPWDNAAGESSNPSRMMWVIGDADGIGWFGLESQGVLGYWGLAGLDADLGYSVYFLEGPQRSDLPPRLFGLNYGVRWRDELSERWSYELAIAPGIYTDFEDSAREGLRVQGHGFGMWTLDTIQFVLGVDYLDRQTIAMLPIAGIVWAPDEATRLDIVFPRPRIARRVLRTVDRETWCYVRGEYGGDSWSVEREPTGLVDIVTLNELRIAFGLESILPNGGSSVIEIALHVDRELVYRSGVGSFRPTDTVAFSWGSRF